MPCYSPRTIYHKKIATSGIVYKSGKKRIVTNYRNVYQTVPCGHCLGCLRVRQMQYAFRCEQEALDPRNKSMYFCTFTYAPEFLPPDNELSKKDMQDFICRLRHDLPGVRVKYMICGEHGELYNRAHYHAILFFDDFVSPLQIARQWPFGRTDIDQVSNQRFGYVAKYSTKQLGDNSDNWLVPPFIMVSNELGFYFIEKHGDYCRKNYINTWLNLSGFPVFLPRVFMERIFPPMDKVHIEKDMDSCAAHSYYSVFVGNRKVLKEKTRLSYEANVQLKAAQSPFSVEQFEGLLGIRNATKSYNLQNTILSRVSYETGRY